MGASPSKGKGTPATARSSPWSCLTPKLLHLVLRRLSSDADRLRFAAVSRHWRHVANQFRSGWSALPPAIADHVFRRLPTTADRACFAAVCRHWRRVAGQFSTPWSTGLPPELASLVLRRLNRSYADREHFAAVCRHWRYVARQYSPPPPAALPLLCSGHGLCESLSNGETHYLRLSSKVPESRVQVCYGSFGHWILFKQLIGRNLLSVYVESPYYDGAILRLPTHCDEPVDVMFMDGAYETPASNLRSPHFDIHKIIVRTGELAIALVTYGDNSSKVVASCRPGMSSSWSTAPRYRIHQYQDIAVHMGKLYAAANGGDLSLHEVTEDSDADTGKLTVSRIQQVIPGPPQLDGFFQVLDSRTNCYLVQSLSGKLLLVRWYIPKMMLKKDPARDLKVKVFEADFERSLWVEVERLDDQVLFVSSRCSKAMSASNEDDFLQANMIYIIEEDIVSSYFSWYHDTCTCVYDMRRKIIQPISLGEHMITRSEASWYFP